MSFTSIVGAATGASAGCALAILALTSCGADHPGPPPADNGFGIEHVTTTCDHGNRLYRWDITGSIAVAAQDPTCQPGRH